jgi:transmembrane sensor
MTPERTSALKTAEAHEAALASDCTPLDWPRRIGRLDLFREAIAVRKKRLRRRRFQAAAAGSSVLLLAGLLLFRSELGGQLFDTQPDASRVLVYLPEQRTLPDGSVVELKAGSQIAIDFDHRFRRVVLTNGDAHFQVAKEPARPFVVAAGEMEFRAIGTVFAVQLRTTEVELLVTEGRVAVERSPMTNLPVNPAVAEAPSEPLAIVDAGNQVTVERQSSGRIATPRVTPISPPQSGAKLAWRTPRLELNNTPLTEAIEAINRHSPVQIELKDPALGRMEISGALQADNIQPLLQMLESNYGIRAERQESGTLVLGQN